MPVCKNIQWNTNISDSQNIKISYSGNDYLYIILYSNEGESGITKEFQLPLMAIDAELLKVPNLVMQLY